MSIAEKKTFITEDGISHDTLELAQGHNRMIALMNYLDRNPLDVEGHSLGAIAITRWIRANPRLVLTLLPEDQMGDVCEDQE